jgi:hypothetical protein
MSIKGGESIMSKFFEYFVSSMFYVTLGFLVCVAILLALVLVMF